MGTLSLVVSGGLRHQNETPTLGKDILIPSRIRSLENVVSSPAESGVELQPKTNLSIILVAVILIILRCMFYTRKLNMNVSYRKKIARQHSCRNNICSGHVAWSTV